jgi:hypothetical protein
MPLRSCSFVQAGAQEARGGFACSGRHPPAGRIAKRGGGRMIQRTVDDGSALSRELAHHNDAKSERLPSTTPMATTSIGALPQKSAELKDWRRILLVAKACRRR